MQNSLTNLDISKIFNKKILLRVDLNVPLDDDGFIIDDNKIKSILPTLKYLKKIKVK